MSEAKSFKSMTDEELNEEFKNKYGSMENITEANADDPLLIEFFDRRARGRF